MLVAGTVTVLLAPPLLGAIVDLVVARAPAAAITAPALGLLAVAVAAGLLDALGRMLVAKVGEPVLATLREQVVDRALAVAPDDIERAGTGTWSPGSVATSPRCPSWSARPYRR